MAKAKLWIRVGAWPTLASMLATEAMMPRAIGSIMAAPAVLEMNGDSSAPAAAKAITSRTDESPTPGSDSTRNAKRRSSPCTIIASAMMNEPMKRNRVPSANPPNTESPSATPNSTQSTTAIAAVTGIGIASVTHQAIVRARIAASDCWAFVSPIGIAITIRNSTGPANRPTVRRPRSKRSSAGESLPDCSSSVL